MLCRLGFGGGWSVVPIFATRLRSLYNVTVLNSANASLSTDVNRGSKNIGTTDHFTFQIQATKHPFTKYQVYYYYRKMC